MSCRRRRRRGAPRFACLISMRRRKVVAIRESQVAGSRETQTEMNKF